MTATIQQSSQATLDAQGGSRDASNNGGGRAVEKRGAPPQGGRNCKDVWRAHILHGGNDAHACTCFLKPSTSPSMSSAVLA